MKRDDLETELARTLVEEIDKEILRDIRIKVGLDDLTESGKPGGPLEPCTENEIILYIRQNYDKEFSEAVMMVFIEYGKNVYWELQDIKQATPKLKRVHEMLWEI